MSTTVNTAEIDALADLLAAAAPRMATDTSRVIDQVTDSVISATKAGVPVDKGDLRDSIQVDKAGGSGYRWRYIYTTEKQGALLERGTPTTGGPIPWLTGPAQRGSMLLHTELMRVADPL